MSVIKASQKSKGPIGRGKQSLEGVLRDRLSSVNNGNVDESVLKPLVGRFNASRKHGDPKVRNFTVKLLTLQLGMAIQGGDSIDFSVGPKTQPKCHFEKDTCMKN